MRIRQVRPEFWSDALVAAMPPAVRLFYIGLWCVADDYGWLRWNEAEIAAQLFPYAAPKRRLIDVHAWTETLTETGRLVRFRCGCAQIPTLMRHQVNGGKKSGTYRDKHLGLGHSNEVLKSSGNSGNAPDNLDQPETSNSDPEYGLSGKSGKIFQLGNVTVSNGSASGTDPERPTDFKSKMTANGARVP